jgi:hypothetical protein
MLRTSIGQRPHKALAEPLSALTGKNEIFEGELHGVTDGFLKSGDTADGVFRIVRIGYESLGGTEAPGEGGKKRSAPVQGAHGCLVRPQLVLRKKVGFGAEESKEADEGVLTHFPKGKTAALPQNLAAGQRLKIRNAVRCTQILKGENDLAAGEADIVVLKADDGQVEGFARENAVLFVGDDKRLRGIETAYARTKQGR